MVKFKTGYGDQIVKKEVERETESSVWIGGRRNAKRSSYENYWDTWEEAHSYLLQKAERAAFYAKKTLEQKEREYERIRAMEKPE